MEFSKKKFDRPLQASVSKAAGAAWDALSEDEKKVSEASSPSEVRSVSNSEGELIEVVATRRAFWLSTAIIFIIAVLVPIPLGASTYVFSPAFFTGWLVVAMVRSISFPYAEVTLTMMYFLRRYGRSLPDSAASSSPCGRAEPRFVPFCQAWLG